MIMDSHHQLTLEERKKIEELLDRGWSATKIANILKKSRSGIYKEIQRNSDNQKYDAVTAHEKALKRGKNKGRITKINENNELLDYISREILVNKKSVKMIVHELKCIEKFPNLSANTIYSYIDKGMIVGVSRETLRGNFTKMFSNGLIRLPNWVREKTDFEDGDLFEVIIEDSDTVTLRKAK